MKRTPEITSASLSDPVIRRQDFSASRPSWNIIAIAVSEENATHFSVLLPTCVHVGVEPRSGRRLDQQNGASTTGARVFHCVHLSGTGSIPADRTTGLLMVRSSGVVNGRTSKSRPDASERLHNGLSTTQRGKQISGS